MDTTAPCAVIFFVTHNSFGSHPSSGVLIERAFACSVSMRLKMTGNMKRALMVLLLISVLNLSAALPMEPLQKTPLLIQKSDPQPSESVTLGNSQDVRVSSLGFRMKRANSANTKKPARYCAGCFSVIGDPTRPEK